MKIYRFITCLSVWALALGAFVPSAFSDWTSVGTGIDYQYFRVGGTNDFYVTRLDRNNTNAYIDTTYAYDKMAGALQRITGQSARDDDAITWWGGSWGARNKVVAAVNGGFYSTTSPYLISGGMSKGGSHSHFFADSFSGFAWKTDRTPFIGQCVTYEAAKVYVKFQASGNTMVIDGINRTNASNDLVIFTSLYDSSTPSGSRTEVVVQMDQPILTTSGTGYSRGTIRSKATGSGSTWIPFDHIVLSGAGTDGTTLNNYAGVGAEVRVFMELTEKNQPDVQGNYACQTNRAVNWANVFAAINSNYHFLENNVVRVPDAVAHPGYIGYVNLNPRTAICYNSNYVFFIVVDGRSAQSAGIGCADLGYWAKNVLGATDGVNNDGGGSSVMVVNSVIQNVPSDGSERAVCNGLYMANVVTKTQSTTFTASQQVTATGAANVRLGPGTNYYNFAAITNGETGSVLSHAVNGVRAKGYNWWKCDFNGKVGWVAESLLSGGAIPGKCIKNADAEGGFTLVNGSYIANSWTEFEGAYGTNVTGYDETTIRHGGGHSQRIRTWGVGTTSGGCYQRMPATPGSNYTVSVWIYAGDTGSSCSLGVDPSGGTNPNSGVTWSTATTSVSWVQKSVTITAASDLITIYYKVADTDNNKHNGYFDDAAPACTAGPTITLNPTATNLCAGGTVVFKVAATGSGTLAYQWQKNQANLSNGGHYSGVTTTNLTVSTVDTNDAANYRCVVTDANGSTPSGEAALSLKLATTITQQPANATVFTGGTTNFTVAATGDGTITYQWQKNQTNISNGGHYSGCTTATLTISSADANDAANYRCVVTAGCGSTTSFQAALTVNSCSTPTLLNPSFELSNISGVATNWTGYQRTPNPTTVWTIQTASPPTGGGLQYQQMANTSSTGGGGVRQNVTGCTIGATYTIAGWMRGNSTSATCTVKCSPTASTTWSTAINLTPAQTYSGSTWTAFSGTVVATGTSMTIWLDGQTGGTGLNKAECFDAITVTCAP